MNKSDIEFLNQNNPMVGVEILDSCLRHGRAGPALEFIEADLPSWASLSDKAMGVVYDAFLASGLPSVDVCRQLMDAWLSKLSPTERTEFFRSKALSDDEKHDFMRDRSSYYYHDPSFGIRVLRNLERSRSQTLNSIIESARNHGVPCTEFASSDNVIVEVMNGKWMKSLRHLLDQGFSLSVSHLVTLIRTDAWTKEPMVQMVQMMLEHGIPPKIFRQGLTHFVKHPNEALLDPLLSAYEARQAIEHQSTTQNLHPL